MKDITYNGDEIVLVPVSMSSNNNLIIVGNGFSIGDPFMSAPRMRNSKKLGTILAMFFKKDCSGLETAQQELAQYINKVYHNYQNVVVYGHSKCGVMFYKMLSLITSPIISISVSAPFGGCFWADKEQVRKSLKCWNYWIYEKIFSNHMVDQDIITGSEYLKKERHIPEYHVAVNMVSQVYDFVDEFRGGNLGQSIFSSLNKLAGYKQGDGIVSVQSQLQQKGMTNFYIVASHVTSFKKGEFSIRHYLKSVNP